MTFGLVLGSAEAGDNMVGGEAGREFGREGGCGGCELLRRFRPGLVIEVGPAILG